MTRRCSRGAPLKLRQQRSIGGHRETNRERRTLLSTSLESFTSPEAIMTADSQSVSSISSRASFAAERSSATLAILSSAVS
jgi:hypothetical protein